MGKTECVHRVRASIINPLGLHARSAAKIAEIARKAKGGVRIVRENSRVNAKDLLDLLTIACPKGTTVTIEIDEQQDTEILDAIAELIGSGFGETF